MPRLVAALLPQPRVTVTPHLHTSCFINHTAQALDDKGGAVGALPAGRRVRGAGFPLHMSLRATAPQACHAHIAPPRQVHAPYYCSVRPGARCLRMPLLSCSNFLILCCSVRQGARCMRSLVNYLPLNEPRSTAEGTDLPAAAGGGRRRRRPAHLSLALAACPPLHSLPARKWQTIIRCGGA